MREAVLVSNGPGELYTWARPMLRELRRRDPELKVSISLIPCQFASGHEAAIATSFGPDVVTTPSQYLRWVATRSAPPGLGGTSGFVLSLGGNPGMAAGIAKRLGYPVFRYSFEPAFRRDLRLLFVPDEHTARRARRLGAPPERVLEVGNLVADAVELDAPAVAPGRPHVLLMPGSRDTFSVHLIPFFIALVDRMGAALPDARFVWPVSRLLTQETLERGIAGAERATLGGVAGTRHGDTVKTPGGFAIEMVDENQRYAHMQVATIALTIPGTNTLELGIAGVPAVVLLPLNKPEIIPLEGIGHWLGLLPLVGRYLKRHAVRLFVERLSVPVSLPNRFAREDLMVEISGRVEVEAVARRTLELLAAGSDLALRRERLRQTMPGPGAAGRLLDVVLAEVWPDGPRA